MMKFHLLACRLHPVNANISVNTSISDNMKVYIFCYTIPPGTCKVAKACRAGSHDLHYTQTKWLEHRKNLNPAVTSTPSNVQSRYVPWEPHTNRAGISLCALSYLNIRDFSWLRFIFHYTTWQVKGVFVSIDPFKISMSMATIIIGILSLACI